MLLRYVFSHIYRIQGPECKLPTSRA